MLYMQGDNNNNNNNEISFFEKIQFIWACIALLTLFILFATSVAHGLAMIVVYPEYTNFDNGWFTLFCCMGYLFLQFNNPFRTRVDDQTEEGQGNP